MTTFFFYKRISSRPKYYVFEVIKMKKLLEYKGFIFLAIGAIGLFLANFDTLTSREEKTLDAYHDLEITTISTISNADYIMVEIKGEVNHPGIYEVAGDLRVGQVILIAGGLTNQADVTNVNQAQRVTDEMTIQIPAKTVTTDSFFTPNVVRILVEVKGEVVNPGVYSLYEHSRVIDLINQAGGMTDEADSSAVDMARYLVDGETIYIDSVEPEEVMEEPVREIYVEIFGEVISPGVYLVPETDSLQDLIYLAGGVTINCDLSKIDWDIVLVLGASIYIPSYEDSIVLGDNNRININTADLELLITLPGIGDILAQRIIDYRAEYGSFLATEDIMNVSGIKESIYEQVKDLITV